MSYIEITINTDNAAFDDGQKAYEVARILHKLADGILNDPNMDEGCNLKDINGNNVGTIDTYED